jgi:hypothetical protein
MELTVPSIKTNTAFRNVQRRLAAHFHRHIHDNNLPVRCFPGSQDEEHSDCQNNEDQGISSFCNHELNSSTVSCCMTFILGSSSGWQLRHISRYPLNRWGVLAPCSPCWLHQVSRILPARIKLSSLITSFPSVLKCSKCSFCSKCYRPAHFRSFRRSRGVGEDTAWHGRSPPRCTGPPGSYTYPSGTSHCPARRGRSRCAPGCPQRSSTGPASSVGDDGRGSYLYPARQSASPRTAGAAPSPWHFDLAPAR